MARLIRTKKLSAREALAAHLKQLDRVNPEELFEQINRRGDCAATGWGPREGGP